MSRAILAVLVLLFDSQVCHLLEKTQSLALENLHCHNFVSQTNAKYIEQFECWAKQWKSYVKIVSDGTHDNAERLGAIKSISFVCKHFNITGDILVLAGLVARILYLHMFY